jgi:hypothetical protein
VEKGRYRRASRSRKLQLKIIRKEQFMKKYLPRLVWREGMTLMDGEAATFDDEEAATPKMGK